MVLLLVSCWWWSCCFCLAEDATTNHCKASQRRAELAMRAHNNKAHLTGSPISPPHPPCWWIPWGWKHWIMTTINQQREQQRRAVAGQRASTRQSHDHDGGRCWTMRACSGWWWQQQRGWGKELCDSNEGGRQGRGQGQQRGGWCCNDGGMQQRGQWQQLHEQWQRGWWMSERNRPMQRGGGMCYCGSGEYWQDALIKSFPNWHLRWIFVIIWRQNSIF
jgi:hypothetical protein